MVKKICPFIPQKGRYDFLPVLISVLCTQLLKGTFPREGAGKRKVESGLDQISPLAIFYTAVRIIFSKCKSNPATYCINYFDVFSLQLGYDTKYLMSSIRLMVSSLCLSSFSPCQLLSHFLCFKHAGLLPIPRLGQAAPCLRTF